MLFKQIGLEQHLKLKENTKNKTIWRKILQNAVTNKTDTPLTNPEKM